MTESAAVTTEHQQRLQSALAARRSGAPQKALRLLTEVAVEGPVGAALTLTAGRIALLDLDDPDRANAYFLMSASMAPKSRQIKELIALSENRMQAKAAQSTDQPTSPRFTVAMVVTNRVRVVDGLNIVTCGLLARAGVLRRFDLQMVDELSLPPRWPAQAKPAVTLAVDPANGAVALDNAALWIMAQQAEYRRRGVPAYKPWLIYLTDGMTTASEELGAFAALRARNDVKIFAVVTDPSSSLEATETLVGTRPLRLLNQRYDDLSSWLLESFRRVLTASDPTSSVALPAPSWGAWRPPGSTREVAITTAPTAEAG